MKRIELSQNKYALVDDEDYEYINQWKWYYHKGYAVRNQNKKQISMHRVITNCFGDIDIDHINRNRADNRKSNLRICNDSLNQANTSKKTTNTSGYKGVSWNKQANKWTAQITVNNSRIHLGYFDNKETAARKYDEKAKQYFGEYATLNF